MKKVEAKAKEICLTWFSTLFDKYSEKILIDDSDILNSIISSIDEKESKLTVSIINLICEISKKNEFFLTQSITQILDRLKIKDFSIELIDTILNKMCKKIDSTKVFSEFAVCLKSHELSNTLIEILNLILCTREYLEPL